MEPTATIPPGTFLIILAITVLIALVAGYAARMFEERPKPEAQAADFPQAENPVLPEEHTALKVTLDKSLAWHLEVDGKRVAPDEMTAEQRARLVNIIVQIRPWIDGKMFPAATVSAPKPVPPASAAAPSPAVAPVPAKPGEEGDKNKTKLSLGRGFRSLMANDLKVIENTRPPSIVTMIDDFLQKRLAASPLASREIHLEEGSLGEVIVFVGKTRYASVDDVPDPEIQTMIRAAIKDWEKSA
ncbi:MAG: hypothetical protein Fur0016_16140 [Anaerolineales bacterium]